MLPEQRDPVLAPGKTAVDGMVTRFQAPAAGEVLLPEARRVPGPPLRSL